MIREERPDRVEEHDIFLASEEVMAGATTERYMINVKQTNEEAQKTSRKKLEEYKTDNHLTMIKLASKGFKSSTTDPEFLGGPNSPLASIMGKQRKKRTGCCLFCC
jgi:hypothetical protein